MADSDSREDFRPVIRLAQPEEAGALSTLAFRSKAYWGYDIDFMKRCRDELKFSVDDIRSSQSRFYVCENAGEPIGFYALRLLEDSMAELDALFVAPKFIRCGIGTALVEHAKRTAGQLGVGMVVIQGDPNAEAFYLSMGAVAGGYRESASMPGRYLPIFKLTIERVD